mgnify:CR=1 FL=1
MEKKLIIKQPPIIGYLHHGYPLSAVWGNESYLPWFYSNFIQIHSNPYGIMKLDFIHKGWWGFPFNHETVSNNTLRSNRIDINEFIKNAINDDFYVIIKLDEYYIPDRYFYKRKQFIHQTLIYGFNTETKTYNIHGFNEKHTFQVTKLSFEDFNKAFNSVRKKQNIDFFKFNKKPDIKFDLSLVIEWLRYYLYDTNQVYLIYYGGELENRNFGINVYDDLIKYIQITDETNLDIRAFHILWEHKKCMNLRMDYMQDTQNINIKTEILNELINIEKNALTIRNLVLKYNVSHNKKIILRIIEDLKVLKEEEYETLNKLYNVIK